MIAGDKFRLRGRGRGPVQRPPRARPLKTYDPILARIDKLVPGKGDLAARVERLPEHGHVIPTDKVEAVMQAGIAACKARTEAHVQAAGRRALRPGVRPRAAVERLQLVQGRRPQPDPDQHRPADLHQPRPRPGLPRGLHPAITC
ncbi:hypothetical protein ACRAWD_08425 [Caulobacter segnis]